VGSVVGTLTPTGSWNSWNWNPCCSSVCTSRTTTSNIVRLSENGRGGTGVMTPGGMFLAVSIARPVTTPLYIFSLARSMSVSAAVAAGSSRLLARPRGRGCRGE